MREIKLFAGSASQELTDDISRQIDVPVSKSTVRRFADGELKIKIEENIRGRDVFVVQSTYAPADNLLELLLFLDAAKRASADRITAVIPYFGYARQDRKDEPRVPISAKVIANLLTVSGADRILTMDLHAEQIQGFFDIPVDHLYAAPVFIEYYQKFDLKNFVIVSPDAGRVNRVRAFARRLSKDLPIAIVDKRRIGPNQSLVANVIGDVKGKTAIIYDDMIDTGGTMVDGAKAILDKGAKEIFACVVHPLLSRNATERVQKSCIKELIVTDTIPLSSSKRGEKIKVLSVAGLLGEAIKRIHQAESISSLFKEVEE
ncbi:MAG TPA: ribose-phosphate pyrophosphokinase [candidate division WOR-3 bacterium]|uniref:Ribose-phosphate pyrophosphokinase n=1 Tax=candidate division WOR-3 bacterium TaxID=2052148 RepID=A0A9C9ENH5_UNCW3|nr:ribose-phosphate pyrophosphokinase [candidate division WOR-3 bacterium]